MESSSDSPNRPVARVNCYTANQGPRIVGRERDYVWMCSGCGWVNSSWQERCPNPTCQHTHTSDHCCDTESLRIVRGQLLICPSMVYSINIL